MTPSSKVRLLVVDDEPRYLKALRVNLEASGYAVQTAASGEAALELAAAAQPDLILLDVHMPAGIDGYETCRRLREFTSTPIILLTARAETADKVEGLDAGADDYVTKPFSAEELLARVRAVLRRTSSATATGGDTVQHIGDLRLDLAARRVFVGPREVRLSATEYRLLCELAHASGRLLTPEQLIPAVWGADSAGAEHLVWQVIHRLRQKIEADPRQPQYIHTITGLGYCLEYRPA